MTRLRVPDAAAGERLDRFLAALPEIGSRAVAERLLGAGGVLVDGRARPKSYRLEGGEELEFEPPAAPTSTLDPQAMDLAHPVRGRAPARRRQAGRARRPSGAGPLRAARSSTACSRTTSRAATSPSAPGIVHRLDRDTSGLLVVARSPEAHRRLQEMVKAREVTREYLALVVGRPRSQRGTIEAPIGRDRHDAQRHSLDTDMPRDAVTHFEVEELLPRHALLRVTLETGRTHQIRVHLAAIDLPVAGDPIYGRPGELGLERQFLHAARLAFTHPITGADDRRRARRCPTISRRRSNARGPDYPGPDAFRRILVVALAFCSAAQGSFPGANGRIVFMRAGKLRPRAVARRGRPGDGIATGARPRRRARVLAGRREARVRREPHGVRRAATARGAMAVGPGDFPAWSPGGDRLVVSRSDGGVMQLYVLGLDDGSRAAD